jgi:hypothetical protein
MDEKIDLINQRYGI